MKCFKGFATCLLPAALCVLCLAPHAEGHGFKISLVGDQIVAVTDDVPALYSNLFRHSLVTTVAGQNYQTDHGLFAQVTSGNVFGANDTFRFDVVGPVWYSSGGAATPADSGITLEILNKLTPFQSVLLDGLSTGTTAGFAIPATTAHAADWYLDGDNPGDVDLGAYGVRYQIQGFKNGDLNMPYDMAEVVFVFDTLGQSWAGGSGLGSLQYAQDQIYQAALANDEETGGDIGALPEPASWLAATFGLLMLRNELRRRSGSRAARS